MGACSTKVVELPWEAGLAMIGLQNLPRELRLACSPAEFDRRHQALIRQVYAPTDRVSEVEQAFIDAIDPRDWPRFTNNLFDRFDATRPSFDVAVMWGLQHLLRQLRTKTETYARRGMLEAVARAARCEKDILHLMGLVGMAIGGIYEPKNTQKYKKLLLKESIDEIEKAAIAVFSTITEHRSPFLLLETTIRTKAARKQQASSKHAPAKARGRSAVVAATDAGKVNGSFTPGSDRAA